MMPIQQIADEQEVQDAIALLRTRRTAPNSLAPLEVLYEAESGSEVPLPPELARLYGPLRLPLRPDRPLIIGNFVTTLDGVVSLNEPGNSGGGAISGENAHDRMTMGILRAVADVVIVGAGTLRAEPGHRWTAAFIAPRFAAAYQSLRDSLGKPAQPMTVIVSASGAVDLTLPVFESGATPVLIVTTARGAERIGTRELPRSTHISVVPGPGPLKAGEILRAVRAAGPGKTVLLEGGPRLIGDFFAGGCLDELFLTLAPQVAGREPTAERPGLVNGHRFAPDQPLWGTLVSLRRSGSHLFLRYAFSAPA
jgi:riboflavin biosynthesis pyrimidine reductase